VEGVFCLKHLEKYMPSSHICLNVHLVFSTKDRLPQIKPDWQDRLHAYLGGTVKGLDAVPLAIGGIYDHVHLLVSLKSKHRLDYFLRELKADSSGWVHKELTKEFQWQVGYGAFSVSPNAIDGVKKYIARQAEHHKVKTFEDEYLELLQASGIEFDEKYLW
jgi:REP element-mobilizing transposase RayT